MMHCDSNIITLMNHLFIVHQDSSTIKNTRGVPQLLQEAIFKTETTLPVVFLGKFGPLPTETTPPGIFSNRVTPHK